MCGECLNAMVRLGAVYGAPPPLFEEDDCWDDGFDYDDAEYIDEP